MFIRILNDKLQPWEENVLHANILESTLKRDPYTWKNRRNDFNIWEKPSAINYDNIPVTIFEAGTKKEMIQKSLSM